MLVVAESLRCNVKRIDCACGQVIEAENDDELWEKARAHLRTDPPGPGRQGFAQGHPCAGRGDQTVVVVVSPSRRRYTLWTAGLGAISSFLA